MMPNIGMQVVIHVVGVALAVLADDMIWIDACSGVSLAASSVYVITMHQGHVMVGGLFFAWSCRLSLHLIARRVLLGKQRARCVVPGTKEAMRFALSRLIWVCAMVVTMHCTPTRSRIIRFEFAVAAVLALMTEAYADAELLAFRYHDRDHACYQRGLWAVCRHPNMASELVFHASVCLLLVWHAPHKPQAILGANKRLAHEVRSDAMRYTDERNLRKCRTRGHRRGHSRASGRRTNSRRARHECVGALRALHRVQGLYTSPLPFPSRHAVHRLSPKHRDSNRESSAALDI